MNNLSKFIFIFKDQFSRYMEVWCCVVIWNIPTVKVAISETIEKVINLFISDSDIQDNLKKFLQP